jgi:hypothetical protein
MTSMHVPRYARMHTMQCNVMRCDSSSLSRFLYGVLLLYLHINGKRMSLPTVVMTAFSTLLTLVSGSLSLSSNYARDPLTKSINQLHHNTR